MGPGNGIISIEFWDVTEKYFFVFGDRDKLPQIFQERQTENFQEGELKNIYRKFPDGAVRLVVDADDELFAGSRGAALACAIGLRFCQRFKQTEEGRRQHFDSIIKRFAHNFIKFQTRFKGNFNRLISDKARSRPYSEFQEEVRRRIEENTNQAAHDVCQISHRAVDLDAQIETLRIISGYADVPSQSSRIKVSLQKTIHRLINPFVEEFQKKKIEIKNEIPQATTGDEKTLIEPSLFNAAFWQLLDNVSKYALEGTTVTVSADLRSRPQKMEINMISICIDPDEEEAVFFEGTKGRHSGTKGESGIGLFIVKKALKLMGAQIHVKNEGFVEEKYGYRYCRHKFSVEFAVN